MLLIAGAAVLAGAAFTAWFGTRAALGTPADRAAANHRWRWPDLADPGTLADFVRQAIAAVHGR